MASYRLDLAYEGTRFKGWARQPGERTVQDELERALEPLFGEPIEVTVGGRTDAGVHARAQVVSFNSAGKPPPTLLRALNALTPTDMAVHAAGRAPDGFNARRDALSRHYRYRIETASMPSPFERRYALHWPYRLDREALDAGAVAITGKHDFTAFTPTDTEHVHFERRVLEAGWREDGDLLIFEIEADAFMRNMVRVIVGTLLEIGTGRRSLESLVSLLEGAPREQAGDTAQPHGLFLTKITYLRGLTP